MAVIFASVDGLPQSIDGIRQNTYTLGVALNRASAGDVVQVLPGRYSVPQTIRSSGEPERPIILRGMAGVVFDGQRPPTAAAKSHLAPDEDDFYFLFLSGVRHVSIEGIHFERCWPTAVLCRGVHDITIRDCEAIGGQFFCYVRNQTFVSSPPVMSSGIKLEGVRWTQDPDKLMWSGTVSWEAIKHEKDPTDRRFEHFNGAMFGSFDIAGNVTIKQCQVSHAFNVIRMDARADDIKTPRNANVFITDCSFEFIRDNVIEPEKVALNWWITGNRIRNAHAWFSLDGVVGGYCQNGTADSSHQWSGRHAHRHHRTDRSGPARGFFQSRCDCFPGICPPLPESQTRRGRQGRLRLALARSRREP